MPDYDLKSCSLCKKVYLTRTVFASTQKGWCFECFLDIKDSAATSRDLIKR
jgi:hypothetical protein